MAGLDDLIGSLARAQSGGGDGAGLEDILGGILGGAGGGGQGGGGGLGDLLGGLMGAGGGGGQGGGGLGGLLGGLLGGGGGQGGGGGLGGLLGGLLGGGGQSSGASGGGGLMSLMGLLAPVIGMLFKNGGLSKILSGLQANGLSQQADSWISTGPNEPISPDDVERSLGDQVDQVAQQLGIDRGQASEILSGLLPGLVNTVSPDGQVPSDTDIDRLVEVIQGFGR